MTQQIHTEAEQTRKLWREYQTISGRLRLYMRSERYPETPSAVGQVVRLLRDQHRILDELLGLKST